jgi:uncharacterized membrane protein SpoIIM required for sporulation
MSIGAGLFVFSFNSPWFKALLIGLCVISFLLRVFAYWYDHKGPIKTKTDVYGLLFASQINFISNAIQLALLTSSLSLWVAVPTIMIIQIYFNYIFCESEDLFYQPKRLND